MLGVSEAATVGLHFQNNYCAAPSYTGFPVTLTAFGIAPSQWQNLTPMDTGYSCGLTCGPYSLNQVISTNTSTGGLNPLPNGSITVTWSASSANFSGFAGYGGSLPGYQYSGPPGYDYDGQPPTGRNPPQPFPTGEWEVYSSFLRDGVEFGPVPTNSCMGAAGGDNFQEGYMVDVVGLKSLFTNTPFVVELIAASDSMQVLTNAFIIDSTSGLTNSTVDYPSTAFPSINEGGTSGWYRGHGGGLSTVSGVLNTDHLTIIGNRAQHGTNGGPNGFCNASTISGFIVTDKPVISMSPQQVVVCGGDTVLCSGYAVGVPPLSYQWRKNGAPIPGATTSAYGITNVNWSNIGTYDLRVTNLYGTALSSAVTIGDEILSSRINNLVVDSNPKGPPRNGLNFGASWLASSTDGASVTRTGVMSFNASVPSQITVAAETNFNSSTGTIMFWMRSSGLANPAGNPATLFDRLNVNGSYIVQNTDGTLLFDAKANGAPVGTVVTTNSLSDNRWHQVAVVYDQSPSGPLGGIMALYVDGQFDSSTTIILPWSWQPGQELEFGLSHDTNSLQPYNGLLDDVRFYNRALTNTEIASAFGGALVDTNALVMWLNFDGPPSRGITLRWQCLDAVLQSADKVNGPYSDIPGAASPYSVGVQQTAKFFRYHGHTPAIIVSNPYLM
jgi:hypothetical protein